MSDGMTDMRSQPTEAEAAAKKAREEFLSKLHESLAANLPAVLLGSPLVQKMTVEELKGLSNQISRVVIQLAQQLD